MYKLPALNSKQFQQKLFNSNQGFQISFDTSLDVELKKHQSYQNNQYNETFTTTNNDDFIIKMNKIGLQCIQAKEHYILDDIQNQSQKLSALYINQQKSLSPMIINSTTNIPLERQKPVYYQQIKTQLYQLKQYIIQQGQLVIKDIISYAKQIYTFLLTKYKQQFHKNSINQLEHQNQLTYINNLQKQIYKAQLDKANLQVVFKQYQTNIFNNQKKLIIYQQKIQNLQLQNKKIKLKIKQLDYESEKIKGLQLKKNYQNLISQNTKLNHQLITFQQEINRQKDIIKQLKYINIQHQNQINNNKDLIIELQQKIFDYQQTIIQKDYIMYQKIEQIKKKKQAQNEKISIMKKQYLQKLQQINKLQNLNKQLLENIKNRDISDRYDQSLYQEGEIQKPLAHQSTFNPKGQQQFNNQRQLNYYFREQNNLKHPYIQQLKFDEIIKRRQMKQIHSRQKKYGLQNMEVKKKYPNNRSTYESSYIAKNSQKYMQFNTQRNYINRKRNFSSNNSHYQLELSKIKYKTLKNSVNSFEKEIQTSLVQNKLNRLKNQIIRQLKQIK